MYWARTIWETSVRALVGGGRRFELAKVRTAREVRGEPGERRLTRPARVCSIVLLCGFVHGSQGLAGCAQQTPGALVQHLALIAP